MSIIDVRSSFPVSMGLNFRRVRPNGASDVDTIAIHYTFTTLSASATQAQEMQHLQDMHTFHKSKGWGGIAYSFVGFPSGRQYYVFDMNRWGANVAGNNDHVVGIAGVFKDDGPPDAVLQAAYAEAILFADTTYLTGPQRQLKAHREMVATSCPGSNYQQWVPKLRKQEDEVTDAEFLAKWVKLIVPSYPGGMSQVKLDVEAIEKKMKEAGQKLQA